MTAKEYLERAKNINGKIHLVCEEITRLRSLSESISSPSFEEKVQHSTNIEAPFVKYIEKIMEKEEELKKEVVVLCQENGHIKPLLFGKISKMHKPAAFIDAAEKVV